MGLKQTFASTYVNTLRTVGLLITFCGFLNPAMAAGTGSTGGGNLQEADFVITARVLQQILEANPDKAAQVLRTEGISEKFLWAIDNTEVHCAHGTFVTLIRRLKKIAYFDTKSNSIYLDCPRYEELKNATFLKETVVFHEYMRKLGLESSNYRVSSHLFLLLMENQTITPQTNQTRQCSSGHRYSAAYDICLPEEGCRDGLVQDPQSRTICIQPDTGKGVTLLSCASDYVLTVWGCFPQSLCHPGYGLKDGECVAGIGTYPSYPGWPSSGNPYSSGYRY